MSPAAYIPDESAIRIKAVPRMLKQGKIGGKILIHRGIISSLEAKGDLGDLSGISGLNELRLACAEMGVGLEYIGDGAQAGSNNMRRALSETALALGASIVTCDPIMARLAEALGAKVVYESPERLLRLEEIFSGDVMSLHLKEGVPPRVKRGAPSKWFFEDLRDDPLSREDLEMIISQITQDVYASLGEEAFIEVSKPGATIMQLRDYRIVITRPPFSDGLEITVVRPILRRRLRDYGLPPRLVERLEGGAEGIMIAGPPGMGKSTFAQALAEHYRSLNKVVKTIESPRDLQLPPDITQYSKSASKEGELHDVLLLSRPDYTIFDEMRDEEDFKVFIDLRFAGIGMVGVIHATNPIDAIQRVANKVDVGVLPSIVDTVIFMDGGIVSKIHTLEMTVKVPAGLRRGDLARPTVLVKNFATGEVEYELYVFGERTFVVPIKRPAGEGGDRNRAMIAKILSRHVPEYDVDVDEEAVRLFIPSEYKRAYLKKCQSRILKLCKRLNLQLEVASD
ncbi:MAG: ATPase, T2SS/T4P/T4SS family [Candidatus Bathyarchaeia archaeon]